MLWVRVRVSVRIRVRLGVRVRSRVRSKIRVRVRFRVRIRVWVRMRVRVRHETHFAGSMFRRGILVLARVRRLFRDLPTSLFRRQGKGNIVFV